MSMLSIAKNIYNIFHQQTSDTPCVKINGKYLKDCTEKDEGKIEFIFGDGDLMFNIFNRELAMIISPIYDDVEKEFREYVKENSCVWYMPNPFTIIVEREAQ